MNKICHFMYVPFTGLGLYSGMRGNAWLKNRIKIFKQFVIPSLQNQTSQNFILWCSWRYEEKRNPQVVALKKYLDDIGIKNVFTYSGICFFDDKHPDEVARVKLIDALHGSMGELINVMGDCEEVLMTIQPSDDCYHREAVDVIQTALRKPELQAFGFSKGYIMNYLTKELANYNPTTNPPFVTVKFPREIFIDPLKHCEFTVIKHDVGKYKKGTPCPSHEYYKDVFGDSYEQFDYRGFLVGTHQQNISTNFNIPFKGDVIDGEEKSYVLDMFRIREVPNLKIKIPLNKRFYFSLPYKIQRKIRYWLSKI